MQRAWAAKHAVSASEGIDPCASTARLVPEHRSRVQAQLCALKRRAAFREQKLAAAASVAAAIASGGAGKASAAWLQWGPDLMGGAEAAASIRDSLHHWGDDKSCTHIAASEHVASRDGNKDYKSIEGTLINGGHESKEGAKSTQTGDVLGNKYLAEPADRPRFRGNPDQLRHQLAGLHRKAAIREHSVEQPESTWRRS